MCAVYFRSTQAAQYTRSIALSTLPELSFETLERIEEYKRECHASIAGYLFATQGKLEISSFIKEEIDKYCQAVVREYVASLYQRFATGHVPVTDNRWYDRETPTMDLKKIRDEF